MKITVKFDVLYYDGKKGKIKADYECPDFETIVYDCIFKKGEKITVTPQEQADDWVSTFDKSEWMNENDIHLIFNWEITSCKVLVVEPIVKGVSVVLKTKELVVKAPTLTQSEMVLLLLEQIKMDEKMKHDFIAVYQEMKGAISNLKFDKQFNIVMKAMGVAYTASIATLDHLEEFKNNLNKDKPKQIN